MSDFLISLEELQETIINAPSTSSQSIDQLNTFSAAFNILKDFLQPVWPLPDQYRVHPTPPDSAIHALHILLQSNGQDELLDWFKSQIQRGFRNVENETRKFIARNKELPSHQLVSQLVDRWNTIFLTWYEPLRVLTPEDLSGYTLYSNHFYSCLLSCIPDVFPSGLKMLFTLDLKSTALLFQPSPSYPFHPLIKQLTSLGLLQRFRSILFSVGYDAIDQRIQTVCRGEWGESTGASLEGMLHWFRDEIGGWLFKVLEAAQEGVNSFSEQRDKKHVIQIMRPAMSRFEYHIYESLAELRINELFDIIVDFPDTLPALQDLKVCMVKTDKRSFLVQSLRAANNRRLLHPGADTQDIITQYISVMKALRVLDAPGVLLSYVAQPVRAYLRAREDTIRCIVTSLVEPGHSLEDELDRAPESDQTSPGLSSGLPIQEENDYHLTTWFPDPVDAPVGYKTVIKDDVIESLVSIYENRDGFVKELQNLLASRLLAVKGFDVTQDLARIEILKGKFGEANLQPCDIMLKDISDSKRVDTTVHEVLPQMPIHPIIISRFFWPNLASYSFLLSPQLLELVKAFEQTYTSQKVDRRLRWFSHLGSVEIDVVLQDRTLSLEVSTLQASIIDLFGQSDVWTISRLKETLRIKDATALRNGLYFWSNHEVLKEVDLGVWNLFESRESFKSSSVGLVRHVIQDPSAQPELHQAKIEKLRATSVFITGMLANLGSLTLDRIYGMMTNVGGSLKGTLTREELLKLLQTMEREGSIIMLDHQWKLLKK